MIFSILVTLGELARRLECPVEGDAAIEIHRVAKIETAGPGDLTFLANPSTPPARGTKASAVICRRGSTAPVRGDPQRIAVSDVCAAAQVLSPVQARDGGRASTGGGRAGCDRRSHRDDRRVRRDRRRRARRRAHRHSSPRRDRRGTAVGADCVLHAHVSIRERCVLGARVIVQNGAVIGSDGYGFAQRPDGSHEKIPQTGPVVIEDDVEIGANTTIDRPAVGETRIKAGTKIDNLVQIAHGVVVGRTRCWPPRSALPAAP